MFPCTEVGVCSIDELTRSKNKGELQEGLEIYCNVPGKLTAEILTLNYEINCLKTEIRTMKVSKDEQIKEHKQVNERENTQKSIQEEVIAQITRVKI